MLSCIGHVTRCWRSKLEAEKWFPVRWKGASRYSDVFFFFEVTFPKWFQNILPESLATNATEHVPYPKRKVVSLPTIIFSGANCKLRGCSISSFYAVFLVVLFLLVPFCAVPNDDFAAPTEQLSNCESQEGAHPMCDRVDQLPLFRYRGWETQPKSVGV